MAHNGTAGCILFLEPGNELTKNLMDPLNSEYVEKKEKCQDWTMIDIQIKLDQFLRDRVNLNDYYVTTQVSFFSRLAALSNTVLHQLGDGIHTIYFYLTPRFGTNANANVNANVNNTNNTNNDDDDNDNSNNGGSSNSNGNGSNGTDGNNDEEKTKYDWNNRIGRMFVLFL